MEKAIVDAETCEVKKKPFVPTEENLKHTLQKLPHNSFSPFTNKSSIEVESFGLCVFVSNS